MANYYQQWSELIELSEDPMVRAEQTTWVREVLCSLDDDDDGEEGRVKKLGAYGVQVVDVDGWPGFQWSINAESGVLWVYAEERANLDHLACFVQAFLRKFYPERVFRLTWSETCAKMRPRAFSGGALYVTKDTIRSWAPRDFFYQMERTTTQSWVPDDH